MGVPEYPGADGDPCAVQYRLDLLLHEGAAVPHPHQDLSQVPLRLKTHRQVSSVSVYVFIHSFIHSLKVLLRPH